MKKLMTKFSAVLMAVIMVFATLGVTAFAATSVEIYAVGSATDMSAKIVFTDCNHVDTMSTPAKIKISTPRTCKLTFITSTPSAKIEFYKGSDTSPSVSFTTPKYFPGMPSTLETSVNLGTGDYTVAIKSADSSKRVSGYFILDSVSGIIGN